MVVDGYKQTEIGVIPEDWETICLGDICIKIQDGNYGESYPKANEFIDSGIPFLTSKAIGKDGILKRDLIDFISEEKHQQLTKAHLKINDVLFTNRGASVGAIGFVDNSISNGNIGPQLTLLRVNDEIVSSKYLFYVMKSDFVRNQISSQDSGSAMNFFGIGATKKFKCIIPSRKAEQTAIANALSDMDALIAQTEKLIEKKKAIKQGVMQELLKPKDGWVTKKLGDLVDKVTTGKLDANAMKPDGEYRFYTCAKEYYFIDRYSFDDEALLISGNGANVGYIHYYKGKFNAYQRTYVLIGFQIDVSFLKIYLDKHLADRITTEVSAGNTPYIKMDTITEMVVQYPPESNEQSAISNQINDINIEIELINTKLQKLKQQKQGMMQALLTGKIRLI